jgi:predicted NodU family carbamoyl transferase
MYEEAFFNLLNALHSRAGLKDLTLAGGCAMNSVANGKVRRCTPFRRLYVQSAAPSVPLWLQSSAAIARFLRMSAAANASAAR